MAHSLGISETLPEFPSIVIGSIAVHPIEMAAAYAAVADNGVYHAPSFVDHIVDRSGFHHLRRCQPGQAGGVAAGRPGSDGGAPGRRAVRHGHRRPACTTGRSRARRGRPAAASTPGSTGSPRRWRPRSGWATASAEVPMLDVGGVGEVYGGTFPAHTWHDFMSNALANLPAVPFTPPNYAPAAGAPTTSRRLRWWRPTCSITTAWRAAPGSTYGYNSYNLTTAIAAGVRPVPARPTATATDTDGYSTAGHQPRTYHPPATQPPVTQPPATAAAGHHDAATEEDPPPVTGGPLHALIALQDVDTALGPASPPAVAPARAGRAGGHRAGVGRARPGGGSRPAPLVTRSPSNRRWRKPIWPPSRGEPRRSTGGSTAVR